MHFNRKSTEQIHYQVTSFITIFQETSTENPKNKLVNRIKIFQIKLYKT